MKLYYLPVVIVSTLTLVACGGSGDGDAASGVSYTGPTAAITLDPATVTDVGGSALDAGSGDFVTDAPLPVGADGQLVAAGVNINDVSKSLALDLIKKKESVSGELPVGATTSYVCDGGVGSFTLTTGSNSVSATYNNCSLSGIIVNGTLSLVINSVTGDFENVNPPWSISLTINYNQLTMNSTIMVHGDISMSIAEDISGNGTVTIGSNSLYVSAGSEQALMTNYSWNYTFNNATNVETVSSDFTYAGTDIGGSVTVDTTTPFVFNPGDLYPNTGAMNITGANNAKIWMNAVDATQVYIEWDIDPIDGNPDNNQTVLWSTL